VIGRPGSMPAIWRRPSHTSVTTALPSSRSASSVGRFVRGV
jgi:hypothetical protein